MQKIIQSYMGQFGEKKSPLAYRRLGRPAAYTTRFWGFFGMPPWEPSDVSINDQHA